MTASANRLTPLDEGGVCYGATVESGSPALVELVADTGVDWVWLDLEHKNASPLDSRYLESVARAAECGGAELVVRVPSGDPHLIRKVRDAGIRSLVVPRVESAAEVRAAVRAAYFTHDGEPGERGLSFGRSSRYGAKPGDHGGEYTEREDRQTVVGVLVEDVAAVEALDDILAVPGLDFVFPGPGDLGVSLGRPREYDHPDLTGAVDSIERTCRERGMPMLGHVGSNFQVEDLETSATDGYRLISLGDEFEAIRRTIGERLEAVGGG